MKPIYYLFLLFILIMSCEKETENKDPKIGLWRLATYQENYREIEITEDKIYTITRMKKEDFPTHIPLEYRMEEDTMVLDERNNWGDIVLEGFRGDTMVMSDYYSRNESHFVRVPNEDQTWSKAQELGGIRKMLRFQRRFLKREMSLLRIISVEEIREVKEEHELSLDYFLKNEDLFSLDTFEVKGHWHFEEKEGEERDYIEEARSIDFVGDTIAILGRYYGEAWHDLKSNLIGQGSEGYVVRLDYRVINGDLLLLERESKKRYLAKRCEKYCCDKQEDFFYSSKINIDLPIQEKKIKGDTIKMKMSLVQEYSFGIPKKEYVSEFGNEFMMQLGDKLGDTNIDLYNEKHTITVSESQQNNIQRAIYADKNTPMTTFFPVFDFFETKKKYEFYFVLREEDYSKKLNLIYRKFDFENYDWTGKEDMILEEWLGL